MSLTELLQFTHYLLLVFVRRAGGWMKKETVATLKILYCCA